MMIHEVMDEQRVVGEMMLQQSISVYRPFYVFLPVGLGPLCLLCLLLLSTSFILIAGGRYCRGCSFRRRRCRCRCFRCHTRFDRLERDSSFGRLDRKLALLYRYRLFIIDIDSLVVLELGYVRDLTRIGYHAEKSDRQFLLNRCELTTDSL
jgi:hypothetical protein